MHHWSGLGVLAWGCWRIYGATSKCSTQLSNSKILRLFLLYTFPKRFFLYIRQSFCSKTCYLFKKLQHLLKPAAATSPRAVWVCRSLVFQAVCSEGRLLKRVNGFVSGRLADNPLHQLVKSVPCGFLCLYVAEVEKNFRCLHQVACLDRFYLECVRLRTTTSKFWKQNDSRRSERPYTLVF